MKKVLYSSALVVLVAFSACKKDYTCECVSKDNTGAELAKNSVTFHASKKDAENSCNTQASSGSGGSSVTMTCEIK